MSISFKTKIRTLSRFYAKPEIVFPIVEKPIRLDVAHLSEVTGPDFDNWPNHYYNWRGKLFIGPDYFPLLEGTYLFYAKHLPQLVNTITQMLDISMKSGDIEIHPTSSSYKKVQTVSFDVFIPKYQFN